MSNPTLPPYLGSWEELLQALQHNPLLASGRETSNLAEAEIRRSSRALGTVSPTVSLLMSGIGLKEVASKLTDPRLKNELTQAADQAIAGFEDDITGSLPHPHPNVLIAAIELVAFANTLQEGNLRNEVTRIAGRLIQKTFAPATVKQAATATR